VVLDARDGRVVAMAGAPTYDPNVWVGGISARQLSRLYSAKGGYPLLARATQGQFAPGSTWKPFMTAGAFSNGMGPSTRLDCSPGFQVGNRLFKNYESESFGFIGFDKALQISCDTFFYRVGFAYWQKFGSDKSNFHAKDPLVTEAKRFGFGSPTGIDLPGEATGRIADRKWKLAYWKANKSYYCKIGKQVGHDFLHVFAREFCLEGYQYHAGDAVNFSIGQGDTLVTPLQSARAYAALANGGTLYEPRVAKAVVAPDGHVVERIPPKVQAHVKVTKATLHYIDTALLGTAKTGTTAWKFIDFPLDKVHIRSKTGSAEVQGKQSTSWVASYDKNYVVLMMVTQGGTGSGTSGPAVRKIWEALYGVKGTEVRTGKALLPGAKPPAALPVFARDGEILPPQLPAATDPKRKGSR
jgi:penicillin-binding protein 2